MTSKELPYKVGDEIFQRYEAHALDPENWCRGILTYLHIDDEMRVQFSVDDASSRSSCSLEQFLSFNRTKEQHDKIKNDWDAAKPMFTIGDTCYIISCGKVVEIICVLPEREDLDGQFQYLCTYPCGKTKTKDEDELRLSTVPASSRLP
jgi:hypothetical protein